AGSLRGKHVLPRPFLGRLRIEERARALDEDLRRAVVRNALEEGLELDDRLLESPGAVELERAAISLDEKSATLIELASERERLVDLDRLRLPFQDDEVDLAAFDDAARARPGRLSDERARPEELVCSLEARCDDHRIAEHRVV